MKDTILSIQRLKNTISSNPVYLITFNSGMVLRTEHDSQFTYNITEDMVNKKVDYGIYNNQITYLRIL